MYTSESMHMYTYFNMYLYTWVIESLEKNICTYTYLHICINIYVYNTCV